MGRFRHLQLTTVLTTQSQGVELGPMFRRYKEAEHSSGFSKSKSQSCASRPGLSRGGESPMPRDIEAVTAGLFGKGAGKGILTLSGAGPNGLACFNHTHFAR